MHFCAVFFKYLGFPFFGIFIIFLSMGQLLNIGGNWLPFSHAMYAHNNYLYHLQNTKKYISKQFYQSLGGGWGGPLATVFHTGLLRFNRNDAKSSTQIPESFRHSPDKGVNMNGAAT